MEFTSGVIISLSQVHETWEAVLACIFVTFQVLGAVWDLYGHPVWDEAFQDDHKELKMKALRLYWQPFGVTLGAVRSLGEPFRCTLGAIGVTWGQLWIPLGSLGLTLAGFLAKCWIASDVLKTDGKSMVLKGSWRPMWCHWGGQRVQSSAIWVPKGPQCSLGRPLRWSSGSPAECLLSRLWKSCGTETEIDSRRGPKSI